MLGLPDTPQECYYCDNCYDSHTLQRARYKCGHEFCFKCITDPAHLDDGCVQCIDYEGIERNFKGTVGEDIVIFPKILVKFAKSAANVVMERQETVKNREVKAGNSSQLFPVQEENAASEDDDDVSVIDLAEDEEVELIDLAEDEKVETIDLTGDDEPQGQRKKCLKEEQNLEVAMEKAVLEENAEPDLEMSVEESVMKKSIEPNILQVSTVKAVFEPNITGEVLSEEGASNENASQVKEKEANMERESLERKMKYQRLLGGKEVVICLKRFKLVDWKVPKCVVLELLKSNGNHQAKLKPGTVTQANCFEKGMPKLYALNMLK